MAHLRNKAEAPNKLDTSKNKDKQTNKGQLEKEMKKALRESEVLEHKMQMRNCSGKLSKW